jgi:hypothetical protein
MTPAQSADAGDARQRGPGLGAGLVPSKTSGPDTISDPLIISLETRDCLKRRVNRMRRNVWLSSKLHDLNQHGFRGWRAWFVTLTYAPSVEWAGRHISDAFKRFRKWAQKLGVKNPRYTWVAELQERGAVHYHILLWLPRNVSCPKWDRPTRSAFAFWPHGMTNRVSPKKSMVGYLMKYISKVTVYHEFPKGCRLYGVGGLEQQARQIRSWGNLPTWIKQLHGVGEVVQKAFGRMVKATGEILESPYLPHVCGKRLRLEIVRPVPPTWAYGPYSNLANFGGSAA